jgi:predicted nucleic-acid-binding Zn-ribbon protein
LGEVVKLSWSEDRTKCERCGNADINEITVFFKYLRPDGKEIAGDATTLPKFLYELKYPEEEKIEGAGYSFLMGKEKLSVLRIVSLTCRKCLETNQTETEIQPTKYGV